MSGSQLFSYPTFRYSFKHFKTKPDRSYQKLISYWCPVELVITEIYKLYILNLFPASRNEMPKDRTNRVVVCIK